MASYVVDILCFCKFFESGFKTLGQAIAVAQRLTELELP
jgi:hypothetical protein